MSSYIKAIPVLQFSPPPPPSPPQFQPIPSPDEGGTASENPSSSVTYFSPPPPFISSYEPPPPPPPPATSTVIPILFSSPPPPLLPSPPPPLPSLPSPPPPLPSAPPLIPSSSPPPPVTEPPSIPPQTSPTLSPPHIPKPRIPPPPPLHIGRPSSHVNNSRIKHSPPPPSHRNNNGAMTGASASIAALAGLMMLSFVGAGIWFVRQRKRIPPPLVPDTAYQRTLSFPTTTRQSSGGYRFAYSATDPGLSSSISFFTYEDLSYMTNGFSSQNLLAQGGFGPVYGGTLQDGREVAIKQLKIGGAQGDREFRAEVDIISRVHHRHLVSLVGYCVLEQERLLVYDYVPNQTLYHHLHGLGSPIMDWATRVKIAVGAARGIAYLHEDCHPKIIHRDIKSSNILLDNNFEAQVSDFGLAKLVTDASSTHVSTRVMGTFGYLAPEYALTGKLTAKSDVYSFGVVLLELITGRKPVDVSQHIGDESLVEWARPLLNRALETGEIGELTDPRLEKRYNYREMFQIIEAAAACVRRTATLRPRMAQVVRALDSMSDSDLTNGVRPGVSGVINSGPNTEEIEIFRRSRFASQDYSSDLR